MEPGAIRSIRRVADPRSLPCAELLQHMQQEPRCEAAEHGEEEAVERDTTVVDVKPA